MRSITINEVLQTVELTLEGHLEKKSRYMKKWRKRYGVIYKNKLYTYKDQGCLSNPTEEIDLLDVKYYI